MAGLRILDVEGKVRALLRLSVHSVCSVSKQLWKEGLGWRYSGVCMCLGIHFYTRPQKTCAQVEK